MWGGSEFINIYPLPITGWNLIKWKIIPLFPDTILRGADKFFKGQNLHGSAIAYMGPAQPLKFFFLIAKCAVYFKPDQMSVKIPDQRGSTLKCSLNRVISCRVCALKAWSLLTCLKVNRTIYHFLICHLHRSPMIRLSHKLPINSQKVADKSVSKLLKSCYFIFKFAQKFIFFLLVCTWSWFYCCLYRRDLSGFFFL